MTFATEERNAGLSKTEFLFLAVLFVAFDVVFYAILCGIYRAVLK